MIRLFALLVLVASFASAQSVTGDADKKSGQRPARHDAQRGVEPGKRGGAEPQPGIVHQLGAGRRKCPCLHRIPAGWRNPCCRQRSDGRTTSTFGSEQSRLGDQGLRKIDDDIYLESLLLFLVWEKIYPYASVTLRTQFAPGYNYPDAAPKEQISKFFDPAYLTQSVGLAWEPSPVFTTRLGVGAREVITSQFPGYADDPETAEIEKVRVWGGVENVSMLKWEFAENMAFISRLELFAPFNAMDRVVLRSDNILTAKVNEYVNVGLNAQFVNDVNISPYTQIKQTLSLGVSYTLL